MARRSFVRIAVVALLAAAGSSAALAQSTAITYQGQVKNGGSVVNSPSDFRFSLFTAASGGTQLGSTVTQNNVTVTDGLFTTPVDFGFNPYTSGNRNTFLQIEVRNPAGVGSFIAMGTRQQLTAAPFSLATRGINVNASGNVGIGTTTPTAPLHVFSNTGGPLRNTAVFTDGGFSTFRIAHPSNEVVALGGLNEHTLQIGGLGTSAFNPIMTITPFNSGGRVGIGTATPPESLSVGSFGLPGAVDRYLQISTEGGNAHRAGLKRACTINRWCFRSQFHRSERESREHPAVGNAHSEADRQCRHRHDNTAASPACSCTASNHCRTLANRHLRSPVRWTKLHRGTSADQYWCCRRTS